MSREGLGYRIHLAKALTMPGKQRDLDAAVGADSGVIGHRGECCCELAHFRHAPRALPGEQALINQFPSDVQFPRR